jgi:hypothetical protein
VSYWVVAACTVVLIASPPRRGRPNVMKGREYATGK